MKQRIIDYINFYLENDDEFSRKNEKLYREIQSSDSTLNKFNEFLEKQTFKNDLDINEAIQNLIDNEAFNIIADNILNEFRKSEIKDENVLFEICDKNDITLDSYYYLEAVEDFNDYMNNYFEKDEECEL